jgi:hypothetical protein
MKTDAIIKTKKVEIRFKPYEGEKLKSLDEYFLFYIFETIKSEHASWKTFAIDGVFLVARGDKNEKSIIEIEIENSILYRLTTWLSPESVILVFVNAKDFVRWCNEHGEVFLCERKREVYKKLNKLSEQNKWALKAKLISYNQLWWNR